MIEKIVEPPPIPMEQSSEALSAEFPGIETMSSPVKTMDEFIKTPAEPAPQLPEQDLADSIQKDLAETRKRWRSKS